MRLVFMWCEVCMGEGIEKDNISKQMSVKSRSWLEVETSMANIQAAKAK